VALIVDRPGPCTTVQDRGRPGYRSFGVPVGGAFDRGSLDLANALVGNDLDAAALEFTLVGGVYRAEVDLAIAIAGAPMASAIRDPSGADRPLRVPQSATLRAGEELVVGGTPSGARTYLAVRGGWQSPMILGSRSSEQRLKPGDVLSAEPGSILVRRPAEWPDLSRDEGPIRVVDGPDADPSTGDARLLESDVFRVTPQADRMGLRLEGPAIDLESPADRPSAPVAPGAVQIAGGRPIVLGVAGGTMGGYLHLAHVIAADLDRLAQLRPGDPLRFRRIEVAEARRIDRRERLRRAVWLTRISLIQESP
jgi:biotin-dependent carboxylase-like uncharacterized protein